VLTDLPAWADLVGHPLDAQHAESQDGPWVFLVRKSALTALHSRLDEEHIATDDRIIRPVAQEGFAETGVHVSIDSLEPEPTVTTDGAWWHPVAVTNPHLRIADSPLPLAEVFGVVRDTIAVQDAAARSGREVFRCA
jgi:hypothetical protein